MTELLEIVFKGGGKGSIDRNESGGCVLINVVQELANNRAFLGKLGQVEEAGCRLGGLTR